MEATDDAMPTTSATYDMLMYGGDGINAYYEYFLVIYSILFSNKTNRLLTIKKYDIYTMLQMQSTTRSITVSAQHHQPNPTICESYFHMFAYTFTLALLLLALTNLTLAFIVCCLSINLSSETKQMLCRIEGNSINSLMVSP